MRGTTRSKILSFILKGINQKKNFLIQIRKIFSSNKDSYSIRYKINISNPFSNLRFISKCQIKNAYKILIHIGYTEGPYILMGNKPVPGNEGVGVVVSFWEKP